MIPDNIVFCGLDGAECEEFVFQIERLAMAHDKMDNEPWKARQAAVRLAGAALRWYRSGDVPVLKRHRWSPLSLAMLNKWNDATPERRLLYQANPMLSPYPVINPTPPAATPVSPWATNALPAIRSSRQVIPYPETEEPKFNIKVVASKIQYTGFISRTATTDEYGRRCCILTQVRSEAVECRDIDLSLGTVTTTTTSIEPGNMEVLTLETESGWMSANVAFTTRVMVDEEASFLRVEPRPRKDSNVIWTVDHTGRLTTTEALKVAVIGKTPDGHLTLFFWKRRVWEDADDVYTAELYMIRAN